MLSTAIGSFRSLGDEVVLIVSGIEMPNGDGVKCVARQNLPAFAHVGASGAAKR